MSLNTISIRVENKLYIILHLYISLQKIYYTKYFTHSRLVIPNQKSPVIIYAILVGRCIALNDLYALLRKS